MIKVILKSEPPSFHENVRIPGENVLACLAGKPLPHKVMGRPISATKKKGDKEVTRTVDDFPYWQDCIDDLYREYGGICAYYGQRIPEICGPQVDHHIAKKPRSVDKVDKNEHSSSLDAQVARQDSDPAKAYEWDNFRLASSYANTCKGNWADVLDPKDVEDGWFQIDLDALIVRSDPSLDRALRERVDQSISRLKLSEGRAFRDRKHGMKHFREGRALFELLEMDYPFLARELARQGILRREDLPILPAEVVTAREPEIRLSE